MITLYAIAALALAFIFLAAFGVYLANRVFVLEVQENDDIALIAKKVESLEKGIA